MKKETILEMIIVLLIAALTFILFSRPTINKSFIQTQHVVDSLQEQLIRYNIASDTLKKNILRLDSLAKTSDTITVIKIKYEKISANILHLDADSSIKLLSEYLSE